MIHPAARTPWLTAPRTESAAPRIRPGAYTEEMLTETFDAEFLHEVEDPADFVNARLKRLAQPTPAAVRGALGAGPQPLNPAHLTTASQAEAMRNRLRALGLPAEQITAATLEGPFAIDWGGEERRPYQIGPMNAGALLSLYAVYPTEVADQMVLDEWRRLSAA